MALNHDDGWVTWYIHLNNDTEGTDDGQAWGFAPGIGRGVHVEAGELIGWLGDSGNAENTPPHVHFELHRPDGTKINPYLHLKAAEYFDSSPASVTFHSYRIDDGPEHDGTGNDSVGNDNGILECGETIEFFATVSNSGDGTLSRLSARLQIDDPFVKILYNTKASYSTLDPGESAENRRDWDLRIAPDVPGGYLFQAKLIYTARSSGLRIVDLNIPIVCGEDVTAPLMTERSPDHSDYDVPLDAEIVVSFNEALDPGSVTIASLTVDNGGSVDGTVSLGSDGMSVVFDPSSDLLEDAIYNVVLNESITDTVGNAVTPTAWSFSTAPVVSDAVVVLSQQIDDGPSHDGTGNDSRGNNDGAAQCGEIVEIYITVRNESNAILSGLTGAFSESDEYVRLMYNTHSPFNDLEPGASAENKNDWDLRIEADTPVGHVFTASITFSLLDPIEYTLREIDSVVDIEIPIECTSPVVAGVDPSDGSNDVVVTSGITVTFAKKIDASTVTDDSFFVESESPLPGTVSVSGDRLSATFVPDEDLDYETWHTVVLTSGITDQAGNPLAPFDSYFITQDLDLVSPEIAAMSPEEGSTEASIDSDVVVTFSEAIKVDTVDGTTLEISDGGAVLGEVSVAPDGRTATFTPDALLAYETTYSVTASSGITDLQGNPLVPFESSFETAPPPGLPILASYRIDDGPSHDGTGNDSIGNDNGIAECGETIELYVTLQNDGGAKLSRLSGKLIEADQHIQILYNNSVRFPSLGGDDAAENPKDWDLRVSPDTPDEYEINFTMRVVAREGGPWDIDVVIPVSCSADSDPGSDSDSDSGPSGATLVSVRVDDGPSHDGTGNDSRGNNDGVVQCGETIELYIKIRNDSSSDLTGLRATLVESDPFVRILYNASTRYPDLAVDSVTENPEDWDLRISSNVPAGYEFAFTIRLASDNGSFWEIPVLLPIICDNASNLDSEDPGLPVLVSYRIDDGPSHDGTGNDSRGNNDGEIQCGETIEMYIRLRNDGESILTGLKAKLIESDPDVRILYNASTGYPNLVPGDSAENPKDWDLRIASNAQASQDFVFILRVTAVDGKSWDVEVSIPYECP